MAKKQVGKIAAFTAKYGNKSTASGYKSGIESFLRCQFKLDKLDKDGHKKSHDYEAKFEEYLAEYARKRETIDQTHDKKKKEELQRSYEASLGLDFRNFAQCLGTECKSKQSAREIMTKARLVLSIYGVKVPDEDVMHLKRELKGGRANVDEDITNEMICRIVKGADVRGRAIVLMLASSGLRINECLSLKLKKVNDDDSHIDLTYDPIKIYVSAKDSKNKEARFTFISTEAKKALTEWLKIRDEYIKTAAKHTQNLKKSGNINEAPDHMGDLRVFPYSDNAITSMWETLLTRANLYTNKDEPNKYRIHGLRAFFISAMKFGGNRALGEWLAGHLGYLDSSYGNAPQNAAHDYKKLEPVLRCCIEADIKEELTTQKTELSNLRESTAVTRDAYEAMKYTNEKLAAQMQVQQDQLNTLTEQFGAWIALTPKPGQSEADYITSLRSQGYDVVKTDKKMSIEKKKH